MCFFFGKALHIFIILHLSHTLFASNQYEMVNDTFWRSTSDFVPIPSTSYGTIKLLHSLRVEFDFVLHDRVDYADWQNIFRIGYRSVNFSCHGYGSRYPSLWLVPNIDRLHLSLSQTNNCHYGDWENYPIRGEIIPNKSYSIIIEFNDTWVYFKINDDIHINQEREYPTLNTLYNQNMQVWISTDRSEQSQENYTATLSNIVIQSWNPQTTNIITSPPTPFPIIINPTNEVTFDPTITPSMEPSVSTSGVPTLEPTLNPIIFQIATDNEIDIDTDNEERNDDVSQDENEGITQQSIYFFIIGALLASIFCVCIIGTSLAIICYIKKKRQKKPRRELGMKNVSSLSKIEYKGNILRLKHESQAQNSSANMMDLISHEINVIYESEENSHDDENKMQHNKQENDDDDDDDDDDDNINFMERMESEQKDINEIYDKDSNEKSYNTESEEEGAFESILLNDINFVGNGEGGIDKDIIEVINRKQTEEEHFSSMLNNANAVNDLMLNDVIQEMDTLRGMNQAEISDDNITPQNNNNEND